jgi:uncharacterized protein YbaP (TraB family)
MKFLIVFVFLSFLSFAQSNTSSLLWEIQGPKQDKASYIFGTMHLMDDAHFYFPKKLEKLVSTVDEVFLEIGDVQHTLINPELLMLKEGSFLTKLSEMQMDTLCSWAKIQLLMDKDQFITNFSKAKPFLIYQLILQNELPDHLQSQEIKIEEILATKKKKKSLGLETIESQLALFDSIPAVSQVNLIMTELAELSKVLTNFKLTQENYLLQDVDKIHEELMKDIQDPYFNLKFIDERNAAWVKKIMPLTANQSVLFAVGAGHLGGENGLLNLLKKQGYSVKPIQL